MARTKVSINDNDLTQLYRAEIAERNQEERGSYHYNVANDVLTLIDVYKRAMTGTVTTEWLDTLNITDERVDNIKKESDRQMAQEKSIYLNKLDTMILFLVGSYKKTVERAGV